MKTEDFETADCGDVFVISIKEESDISLDGGHSFEEVKNTATLNLHHAHALASELLRWIYNQGKKTQG